MSGPARSAEINLFWQQLGLSSIDTQTGCLVPRSLLWLAHRADDSAVRRAPACHRLKDPGYLNRMLYRVCPDCRIPSVGPNPPGLALRHIRRISLPTYPTYQGPAQVARASVLLFLCLTCPDQSLSEPTPQGDSKVRAVAVGGHQHHWPQRR